MSVAVIPSYGKVQNIYPYYKTHFNQVQSVPVEPVRPTAGITEISSQEDRIQLGVSYRPEDLVKDIENKAVAKQTQELKNSFEQGEVLQYDLANPYEAARMAVDNMLVMGMNFDIMA